MKINTDKLAALALQIGKDPSTRWIQEGRRLSSRIRFQLRLIHSNAAIFGHAKTVLTFFVHEEAYWRAPERPRLEL